MEDVVAAMELSGPLHGDDIPWIRHHAQQTFVPLGVGTDGAGTAGGEVAADGTEGHLLLGLHDGVGKFLRLLHGRFSTWKARRWADLEPMPGRRANCSTNFQGAQGNIP